MTGPDATTLALAEAADVARAAGYEVVTTRHGDVQLYHDNLRVGSLYVSCGEVVAEGDKRDIRVSTGAVDWRAKLARGLRGRAARLDAERAERREAEERARRFDERRMAGLEVIAEPADVSAIYTEKTDRYPWSINLDFGLTLEEAASVAFALRLAAPFRARRLWREGVREQVAALRASPRFASLVTLTEAERRAVRAEAHGRFVVGPDDLRAREYDDGVILARAAAKIGVALHDHMVNLGVRS